MEWFYQIPGVDDLRSADAFFQFFAVPYQPERLAHCSLPVLAAFHWRITRARTGCWRADCWRRVISNSSRRTRHETPIYL